MGRDPGDIRKQVVLRAILDDTEAGARERLRERADRLRTDPEQLAQGMVIGTPEQCAQHLTAHRDLGAADFLLMGRPPADERTITLFATDVAPALRG